jgi:mRNA-degrading endonuclease YafQ of YafQ-DinJ toxin-antitoxin module
MRMKKGRTVINIVIDFEYKPIIEIDNEVFKQKQNAIAETIKCLMKKIPLVQACAKDTAVDTVYSGVWDCKEEKER